MDGKDGDATLYNQNPGTALLRKLDSRQGLSVDEASEMVRGLIFGKYPGPLAGALLTALALKGETSDELYSFASILREMARPFNVNGASDAIDMCGTGGSDTPSFNVSTVAAFIVAAGGVPVAKHGNSSARGPCGSSDLIEALGLPIKRSVGFAMESFGKQRLAFLHAPLFHPATKAVTELRSALGIRTIFNQLGPLTNPASVTRQLVGAFSMDYGKKAVEVLPRLGCTGVFAVHSDDGADEISPQRPTSLLKYDSHGLIVERIEPSDLLTSQERSGSWGPLPPKDAAKAAVDILSGNEVSARAGAVLLTSSAAFWLAEMVEDMEDGVEMAREVIRSGGASSKLEALRGISSSRDWTREE